MEDADIITDLKAHNGSKRTQYDKFWDGAERFLNEDIATAVDDRRHGSITHLSRAISIRDFVDQVKERCPEGTLIPSYEWARLQFWPKTPSAQKSLHYTGIVSVICLLFIFVVVYFISGFHQYCYDFFFFLLIFSYRFHYS